MPITWSVTLWDWSKRVTTEKIMRKAERQIRGGDVILLHDGCNVDDGLGPQPLGRGHRADPDPVEAAAGHTVRDHPRDDRGHRASRCREARHLARLPAGGHRLERLRPRAGAAVVQRPGTTSPCSRRIRIPSASTSAGRRPCGPDVGGLLPVFVIDRYEGYRVSWCRNLTRAELDAWVEANAAAIREHGPPTSWSAGHVMLGGPVGAATGMPYTVIAHGSELEYSMRGNDELSAWGAETLRDARGGDRRLRAHPRRRSPRSCGPVERRACGAARGGRRAVGAAAARAGAGRAAGGGPPRSAEPRQPNERLPDEGNAERLAAFLAGDTSDRCLLRQADREQGRAGAARRAARGGRPRRDRRLRPRPAEVRAAGGGHAGAVHRAVRAPPPRAPAGVRRRRRWCRRSFPRRSGWSPPRPRRPAARRSSRATPGWRRSRRAWSRPTRRAWGSWRASPAATAPSWPSGSNEVLALSGATAARRCARRRAGPCVERWSWSSVARRILAASTPE